jgi:hypothetical protein
MLKMALEGVWTPSRAFSPFSNPVTKLPVGENRCPQGLEGSTPSLRSAPKDLQAASVGFLDPCEVVVICVVPYYTLTLSLVGVDARCQFAQRPRDDVHRLRGCRRFFPQ